MKIQIQSEKYELSEAQEKYVYEKIEVLKKYCDVISDEAVQVRVHIERRENAKQKQKMVLQVTMTVPKASFRAEVNAFTVEEGVDLIHDKLLRQVERYKTKHLKFKNLSVADFPMVDNVVDDELANDERISKRKLFSDLIPMTEKEAINTMNLLGHTFFVFVNIATDRYNIVYLRHDKETYGLVELEHQDGVVN